MKMTTSIQIVCKYNESMQRLHPLKHSAAAAAALQGAVTEEELDFIADPEIKSWDTVAEEQGEMDREGERRRLKERKSY